MREWQYTVIAVYADNLQRYATSVWACSPEGAEDAAREQAIEDNGYDCELIVAAVIDGDVRVVA